MAKPSAKPDDPAQYQRFRDLAREVEADGDNAALDEAVTRLAKHERHPRPTGGTKKSGKRA